jgi:hypothetical protein
MARKPGHQVVLTPAMPQGDQGLLSREVAGTDRTSEFLLTHSSIFRME